MLNISGNISTVNIITICLLTIKSTRRVLLSKNIIVNFLSDVFIVCLQCKTLSRMNVKYIVRMYWSIIHFSKLAILLLLCVG